MSLRDELLEKGYSFDTIPSILGKFRDIGWEITGLTEDKRPVRHIRSVANREVVNIKPGEPLAIVVAKANLTVFKLNEHLVGESEIDTVLLGPGIKLDFTGASPPFNVDREIGEIVGIWALAEEAGQFFSTYPCPRRVWM